MSVDRGNNPSKELRRQETDSFATVLGTRLGNAQDDWDKRHDGCRETEKEGLHAANETALPKRKPIWKYR